MIETPTCWACAVSEPIWNRIRRAWVHPVKAETNPDLWPTCGGNREPGQDIWPISGYDSAEQLQAEMDSMATAIAALRDENERLHRAIGSVPFPLAWEDE